MVDGTEDHAPTAQATPLSNALIAMPSSFGGGGSSGATATAAQTDLMDGPGHNGLSAGSLLSNAVTQNPKAIKILIASPLNDALVDAKKTPYINLQLTDSNARDVMAEIVSCALDRSDRITYVDPSSHTTYTWDGEMGLCKGWNTAKPSDHCLRLVSSCLFARTNKLHRWVPARFGGPDLPPSRDRVAVATKYPKGDSSVGLNEGTDIAAFSQGWKPGYIGRCVPNERFTLALPRPSRCAEAAIRLCRGIRGCDRKDAAFIQERDHGLCEDSSLTFACPAGGFFGVMTRPDVIEVAGRGAGACVYPAAEKDVFPFLEGAFFGNLFDPEVDGWKRTREVVRDEHDHPKLTSKGLPADDTVDHSHIFACYSLANDEQGVAYLNNRVCAKPGSEKCFPNSPRRCHFKNADVNKRKGYHCKWHSDDGLYRECIGDDGITYPVITVFLHEPCGLNDAGCNAALPTTPE